MELTAKHIKHLVFVLEARHSERRLPCLAVDFIVKVEGLNKLSQNKLLNAWNRESIE